MSGSVHCPHCPVPTLRCSCLVLTNWNTTFGETSAGSGWTTAVVHSGEGMTASSSSSSSSSSSTAAHCSSIRLFNPPTTSHHSSHTHHRQHASSTPHHIAAIHHHTLYHCRSVPLPHPCHSTAERLRRVSLLTCTALPRLVSSAASLRFLCRCCYSLLACLCAGLLGC